MPKIPQPIEVDQPSLSKISFTVDTGAKTLDIGVKEPLIMSLPDASNPGSYVEQLVTPPATIKGDGHASENFNLGEAGQTLAVAWAENYPITWYITVLSGVTYWVCSRNPCMTQMPAAAANIGDFDAAPSTPEQGNAFVAASITEADFVDLPVWPIGTMPVQRAAASEIPTLVALTAGKDGPGLWNEQTPWTMPVLQNFLGNAGAGYLFSDATGDVPTWDGATTHNYLLRRNGEVVIDFATAGSCTQDAGAAATPIYLSLPFKAATIGMFPQQIPCGQGRTDGGNYQQLLVGISASGAGLLYRQVVSGVNLTYQDLDENQWGSAADDIYVYFSYKAF